MAESSTAARRTAQVANSSSEYLSPDELHRLTEARSARKQMAWLAAHSVPFRFNGREVFVLRVVAQEWDLLSRPEPALPSILR